MEGNENQIPEEYIEPKIVSTKEETDKKCPKCGGIMDFDPASGNLKCPYCGNIEMIKQAEEEAKAIEELDFNSVEETGNCDWGVETKTVYCKSCGGEMVYDALAISGECPYCGSNQVMEAKAEHTLAPGGVCLFKIDAKQAATNFLHWIKKRFFCPKEAKQKAKPKDMKGFYLPYWTFDTQTFTTYQAEYGIQRHVKKSDGSTTTKTDWYRCSGSYQAFIDDQPVCGTKQHDNSLLNGILPYNTADNKPYKPEYVAGFGSERYSIGIKDAWEIAKGLISGRLKSSIKSKIKVEHHADDVRSLRLSTNYSAVKYKYLLIPVWMASFKYRDKLYRFMVNGQTGKVSGHIPISPWKVLLVVLGALAAIGLIVYFNM